MTCKDSPCKHNATCVDAAQQCSDDTNPNCSFTCQCEGSFTGQLCNVYRRCYDDVQICYQTDYTQTGDHEQAKDHCLRQGNMTRPIVLNRNESTDLRDYVDSDPQARLNTGSLWLAGQARRLNNYSNVLWQWIDGRQTGRPRAFVE